MSCRTTNAGSALTTLARLQSGLTDVQTLSAYHVLRTDGRGVPAPTQEQWTNFITENREQVQADSTLTEARRASLLARLDRAAEERDRIDGATWHALRNIRGRTDRQGAQVESSLRWAARTLGTDYETVRARYLTSMTAVDRPRRGRRIEGYDSLDGQRPQDHGSVTAMEEIRAEALQVMAQRALLGPQRIERRTFITGNVAEAGYDPVGGRLEIQFRLDASDARSRVYAYQGVPERVWTQINEGGNPLGAFREHVRNHPEYRYRTQVDADLDSAALQCPDCGQFAATGHACPVRIERDRANAAIQQQAEDARLRADRNAADANARAEAARTARLASASRAATEATDRPAPRPVDLHRRSRQAQTLSTIRLTQQVRLGMRANYDMVSVPSNLAAMRAQAAGGPIEFPVAYSGDRASYHVEVQNRTMPVGQFAVTGTAVYDRPQRGVHTADIRDPRCTCSQYRRNGHCPHIDFTVGRLRAALLPPTSGDTPADLDPAVQQARVERALRQDWMRSEEAAAEARASWAATQPEDNYSTNFAAFEEDHAAALARKAAGEDPIPYLTENALDASLVGPDAKFGVELEFDLPERGRERALTAIGEELHAAGLTRYSHQSEYHSDSTVYHSHNGGWKFEEDDTVSGEVISPVMQDTPETWANIATVCDIIKRHGGKATLRTGSHVHVSSGQPTRLDTATELVRMANQHEDVLYRLSQDPARGKHRPTEWCGPNRDVPGGGYRTISAAQEANWSHNFGVNLQAVEGNEDDHAEIRHWDGTLNPAVIQAQIKMSTAMLAAAERTGNNARDAIRDREPFGAHANRLAALRGRSRRALTSDELREDTATTRSFIDTLFARRDDKAQIAALFAVTKWNSQAQ